MKTALADRDFKLTVYSGGSRGLKNTDLLRVLPRGAVEMSLMWSNNLGRDAPALSSVFVQGAISTVDELKAVLPVAVTWGIFARRLLDLLAPERPHGPDALQ